MLLAAILAITLAGCDLSGKLEDSAPSAEGPGPEVSVPEASPPDAAVETLPPAVQAKLDLIRETLKTGSIRSLVRLANQEPDFRSNFGNLNHYDHWYILKRMGLDVIEKTEQVLNQPYGVKDFGAEKYYIWPELAARPPEDLVYSRLTFQERAALLELVSEAGIERVKGGEPYPGFRLAIREDGSWAYLLQDN